MADNATDRVDWLRKYAIPFRSIDPSDQDFADLQPLKEIIGDAKVVQLGEQSHGDGTCFETKIRLIKFLHQEMGFDVLAFESGLYDCHKAWQAFRSGDDPLDAARQGVFGIWTGSAQTKPLWDYLAAQAGKDRPLELCGFDCQFTARASRTHLRDDLRELAAQLALEPDSSEEWQSFDAQLRRLIDGEKSPGSLEAFQKMVERIKAAIAQQTKLDQQEAEFWEQQLTSMSDHCARQWTAETPDKLSLGRDAQMAENLVWLSNVRYPDRKIIVWAASFHIVRDPPSIEVLGNPEMYAEMIQMGELVDRSLGDQVFTVGFTAYDGRAGAYFRTKHPLNPPPEGTLESLMAAAELENALVPLKATADAAWLDDQLHARPLGYRWMRASWPKHFDAIIFNRTMKPSTR